MAKAKDSSTLPVKARVVATKDLVGVPMGTPGRIEVVNGLTWTRYWVHFDNGVWLGSVDAVVAEREWPAYQVRRSEEEARAAEAASRPPAEAAPAEGAGAAAPEAAATSRIPAALLARSQAAKAKKAAAASE